jgi:hypothetical protein
MPFLKKKERNLPRKALRLLKKSQNSQKTGVLEQKQSKKGAPKGPTLAERAKAKG